MKKKSSKIYLVASILVLAGSGMKLMELTDVGYPDLIILAGMALGLVGLNIYLNEIKPKE